VAIFLARFSSLSLVGTFSDLGVDNSDSSECLRCVEAFILSFVTLPVYAAPSLAVLRFLSMRSWGVSEFSIFYFHFKSTKSCLVLIAAWSLVTDLISVSNSRRTLFIVVFC